MWGGLLVRSSESVDAPLVVSTMMYVGSVNRWILMPRSISLGGGKFETPKPVWQPASEICSFESHVSSITSSSSKVVRLDVHSRIHGRHEEVVVPHTASDGGFVAI